METRTMKAGHTAIELEFDVTDAVPVDERCIIDGLLFLPDDVPARPTVVVALPGTSFSAGYWDLQPPGRSGYSQGRYFAERGVVFVAVDYLGGGDRSQPATGGERFTLSVVADAAHEVFTQIRDRLFGGAWGPALEDARYVGFGQSLGGNVLIQQQARYGDYEAIALLGTPVNGLETIGPPLPPGTEQLGDEERRAAVIAAAEQLMGPLPVFHGAPQEMMRPVFFGPFVEDDLIAYCEQEFQRLLPRSSGADVASPGLCGPLAAQITCPVFCGYGEVDVVREPRGAAAAFSASPDITTVVVEQMAHMHNFAPTRERLWERQLSWLSILPGSARS